MDADWIITVFVLIDTLMERVGHQSDVRAMVLDQARFLQSIGDQGNARAPHSQHLAQKHLGQIYLVGLRQVANAQKPTAHAGFHGVTSIATSRLLGLSEQHLFVADEDRAKRLKFIGDATQRVRTDDGSLHETFLERGLPIERLRSSAMAIRLRQRLRGCCIRVCHSHPRCSIEPDLSLGYFCDAKREMRIMSCLPVIALVPRRPRRLSRDFVCSIPMP